MVENIYYGIDEAKTYNLYSNATVWHMDSATNFYEFYYNCTANCTTIQDQWVKKIVTNYHNSTDNTYANNNSTWSIWVDDFNRVRHTPTPSERLRGIIQSRQAPLIIGTRKPIQLTKDPREVRARETLLRVLGEEKFRGFLRNGFVSVRGKSGKVYQIYPGHDTTKVYQNGQMVERLCVVLSGSFPPTDALIMRFLLILNDEEEFRSYAIKHSVTPRRRDQKVVDMRPLQEIFKSLIAA